MRWLSHRRNNNSPTLSHNFNDETTHNHMNRFSIYDVVWTRNSELSAEPHNFGKLYSDQRILNGLSRNGDIYIYILFGLGIYGDSAWATMFEVKHHAKLMVEKSRCEVSWRRRGFCWGRKEVKYRHKFLSHTDEVIRNSHCVRVRMRNNILLTIYNVQRKLEFNHSIYMQIEFKSIKHTL